MLLTGVQSHKTGIGNLRETMPSSHLGKPGYLGSMAQNVITFPTLLQAAGYRTYITGKWNVGSEPYNLPHQRGFDRSIVQGDTGSDNWKPKQRYLPHTAKVDWFEDGREAQMPEEFYSSTYFVDRMIGYLKDDPKRSKDQPFFAYIGFQANHVPIQAPKAFIEKYRGKYALGWDALREQRNKSASEMGIVPKNAPMARMSTTRDWNALSEKERLLQQRQMEIYAAMAEAMDHEVGRFVSHLKMTGEYDNTVFVFLSDNGAEGSDYKDAQLWLMTQYTQSIDRLGGVGAYGIPGPSWASSSVSPLYGYKFYAGEGGIRVPMFLTPVASIRSNQIESALTHVTDLAPTLLEMARVAHPGNKHQGLSIEPMSGKSLVPLLQGSTPAVREPHESLGYELSGNKALFRGDFKLVLNTPPVGDGQWKLYNLREDPGEVNDVRQRYPELYALMLREYADFEKANGVLPMPEGYNPVRQVLINSILNYWLPSYAPLGIGVTLLFVGLGVFWLRRRRTVQLRQQPF